MDVNAIVDQWKVRLSIEGKRQRALDNDSETEGDEEQNAELAIRMAVSLAAVKRGEGQKHILVGTLDELRLAVDHMSLALRQFECDATRPHTAALKWLADHMYESSQESIGQWGMFIRLVSANSRAMQSIQTNTFPVDLVEHDMDVGASLVYLRKRKRMEDDAPELYDFVYETLLDRGFIAAMKPQLPAQNMYQEEQVLEDDADGVEDTEGESPAAGGAAETDEESADDESADEESTDAESPELPKLPFLLRYSKLLESALETLPTNGNLAKTMLLSEDHSIFSHSYDYLISHNGAGGGLQLPTERTFFYRAADVESQFETSPANRNADLAAALRSMVLRSVAIASDASQYAECTAAARLRIVAASDDPWYNRVVDEIRRIHGLMLDLDADVALEKTDERMARYDSFRYANSSPLAATNTTPFYERSPKSPLVELLVVVCQLSFLMLVARYSAGVKTEDALLHSTRHALHMVAFPTPILRPSETDSDQIEPTLTEATPDNEPFGASDDESVVSEELEIGPRDEAPVADADDSQATIPDDDDSQATIPDDDDSQQTQTY